MSQTQTPSAACCNTPAVVSKGYKEKGEWTTVDGLKTYVTGPSTATQGILIIYDIFGFFPQTLQGADILAHADGDHQYQVFMPDFFEGKPADISWYPPDTEEKGKKLGEFFQTTAAPPKAVEKVKSVMKELSSKNDGIKGWGVVGYCWGGKASTLCDQHPTAYANQLVDREPHFGKRYTIQSSRRLSSSDGRPQGRSQRHHSHARDTNQGRR